jgi:two-component system, chemotaxis family, chemotaxis protein CheY
MVKTVLVADDNSSIRFLICSLVRHAGFAVCGEAENGTQAIEKAKRSHPDLILLDLSMPVVNGAEAASILKRLMPGVPIVLFSLHEEMVGRALANRIGVDLFLGKESGMANLVDSMNELLGVSERG